MLKHSLSSGILTFKMLNGLTPSVCTHDSVLRLPSHECLQIRLLLLRHSLSPFNLIYAVNLLSKYSPANVMFGSPLAYVSVGTPARLQDKHQAPGAPRYKAMWPHRGQFLKRERSLCTDTRKKLGWVRTWPMLGRNGPSRTSKSL